MLWQGKDELLSLYNAKNDTNYTNADDLIINTLQNAIYMGMKNDVSFIFEMSLNLYEHQSTINPNMPLRDLLYVAKVLQGMIKNENLYGTSLVKIPTPKFVVFYNGTADIPIEQAVELAVNECIKEGILSDFLSQNKAEAIEMSIFEYNQEAHMKCVRQEGYEDGLADGITEGKLQQLVSLVQNGLLPLETAIQRSGIPESEFRKMLDND